MIKVVISGGDESNNIGDAAILASTIAILRKNIPGANITVFANDPEKIALLYSVKTLYKGRKFFAGIAALLDTIKTIYHADLMIWGGGHLLQDKSSQLYIPFHLSKVFLAKLLRRPVMAYAVGVGPIDRKLGQFLTKHIVNLIDFISVRDRESKDLLKKVGVNNKPIHVTADPAIVLAPTGQERAREILLQEGINRGNGLLIGISPRRWFHHRYSFLPVEYLVKCNIWEREQRAKFEKLKDVIAQSADHLANKYNAEILFVPMYTGSGQEDDKICEEIMATMKYTESAKIISNSYRPQEIMGIFGLMDIVIGMRMHSLILASRMNVPVIGLNYSPKGVSFMQRIGQESYSFNIENDITIDSNVLIEKIETILSMKKKTKEKLKVKVEKLQRQVFSDEDLFLKQFNLPDESGITSCKKLDKLLTRHRRDFLRHWH